MPVPGPRDQFGDHTVRNPDGEDMRFFQYAPYHPVAWVGRTAGAMERTLRGCVLAAGQIRQLWRQSINYTAAQSPYSWTDNSPGPDRPAFTPARGFQISRSLRYLTRSVYMGAGIDNSRLSDLHTTVRPRVRSKATTVGAGQKRSQPTVRNRLSSFGQRVPPLNPRVAASQEDQ